jgi:anti-sigma B factor antagonist
MAGMCMDDGLTFSVSPEVGCVVVSVAGEIDTITAPQFRDRLASVVSGRSQRVVVDLTLVTYLASAGITVLTGTHRLLAGQGGSLVVACPSPAAWRVLSLLGVDQVIPVADSVAEAVGWAADSVELPATARMVIRNGFGFPWPPLRLAGVTGSRFRGRRCCRRG